MSLEAELARQFGREIDSLQQMQDLLAREYQALLDSDVTAIETLSAQKSELLGRQAELGRARRQLLRGAGIGESEGELRRWLQGSAQREALAPAWERIAEMAGRCRDDNRNNGRLIVQKQRRAQGALDILRGAETPGAATYSSSGSTSRAGKGSRTLGRA